LVIRGSAFLTNMADDNKIVVVDKHVKAGRATDRSASAVQRSRNPERRALGTVAKYLVRRTTRPSQTLRSFSTLALKRAW
jgi:hypothetical protein